MLAGFNKINKKNAIKFGKFLFNTDRLATLYKCLRNAYSGKREFAEGVFRGKIITKYENI